MSGLVTAERCKRLREATGLGLMACRKALMLAEGPEFDGDVVLAVAYLEAASYAVHVKGDRNAWNLSCARERAPGLREGLPELDAAFPAPRSAPAP